LAPIPSQKFASPPTVVDIRLGYESDCPRFEYGQTQEKRPDQLWDLPSLLFNAKRRPLPGSKLAGAWRWSLTPSSAEVKMIGATPPLPLYTFTPWRGTNLLTKSLGNRPSQCQQLYLPSPSVTDHPSVNNFTWYTPQTNKQTRLCRYNSHETHCRLMSMCSKYSAFCRVDSLRTNVCVSL